jgi:hypothetical protein
MSQSQQSILERLRQLKQSTTRNNELISNLKVPLQVYTYQPQTASYESLYNYTNPIQIDQYQQPDLYSQMMTDFETRNRHIIESQLYYERSQDLLNDVLENCIDNYDEDELDAQLSQVNIHNFDTVTGLVNAIPKREQQSSDQVKTVHIQANNSSSVKHQIDQGPELTDLTEYEQELVGEFVDTAYTHLIKVLKVYFILSDGKCFRLPTTIDIQDMKTQLEGHIHVPDIDVIKGHIRAGTHIYYLSIDENSHVKLLDGYILKTANTGLVIIDEENNKKKHIDFKCPVFRKINNLDIALYIKKHCVND